MAGKITNDDANLLAENAKENDVNLSTKRKGKRLWKKVKYQLVEYHSLPSYLRDNEFIRGHYRSEWPLKQILFSVFSIHNETLNVWTHLIGFFLFLCLTIYTASKVPKVIDLHSLHLSELLKADLHKIQACIPSLSNMIDLHKLKEELAVSLPSIKEILYNCLPESFSSTNHTTSYVLQTVGPITRWPFYTFLGGAMFCLLASSTCHLLACHSEKMSSIMLRMDYIGIAVLITASFFPPVFYSFMCYPFFCNLYLGFITFLGVATVIVSLLPVFQTPEYRNVRATLFCGMGFCGIAPIVHKVFLFWNRPEALHTTGYELLMGLLYGVGALVYATRIPERWMPGKFDVAGHSHQLFHVFVVAGAYTHYRAGLIYLKWRDLEGC